DSPFVMLQTGREKADERPRIEQSNWFHYSPNPFMYFGLCARSRGNPLTEPARSLARSKHEAARRPRRPRRAVSKLSRTRTDFVTRLAFASRCGSARRSSGSLNEMVRIYSVW